MRCPNLIKDVMHRCRTVDESYCPSHFQLREYCKTTLYKICPFFVGFQKRQAEFLAGGFGRRNQTG